MKFLDHATCHNVTRMKAEKITRYPAKYLVHQTKISLGISTQNCVLPSKRCLLFCIEPPPLLVVGLDTSILCVTSVCIVHIDVVVFICLVSLKSLNESHVFVRSATTH